jgi:hypothetical protein
VKVEGIAAVTLAVTLGFAGALHAQDSHVSDAVTIGLSRLGYDEAVAQSLSPEQMLEVESVLNSSDTDDQEMKGRIDQIIDN